MNEGLACWFVYGILCTNIVTIGMICVIIRVLGILLEI